MKNGMLAEIRERLAKAVVKEKPYDTKDLF